jgi:hypothetical protein
VNPIGASNQPPPGPGPQGDPPTYYTVDSPIPIYQALTTNLEPSVAANPDFAVVGTIADPTITVVLTPSAGSVCTKQTVPGGGWATWSGPPFAEDPTVTPAVIFCNGTSVTLSFFSTATGFPAPLSIFGAEVEPNLFGRFFHDFHV